MPRLDTYYTWKANNVLERNIEIMRNMISKGNTEGQVAKALNIHQDTIIMLKKNYPDVKEALDRGYNEVLATLVNAIYKKAIGYNVVLKDYNFTVDEHGVETTNSGRSKELHFPPDSGAAQYLLSLRGGEEYRVDKTTVNITNNSNYEDTVKESIVEIKDLIIEGTHETSKKDT